MECRIEAKLSAKDGVSASLRGVGRIEATASRGSPTLAPFGGPYVVIPTVDGLELETSGKRMTSDVTIEAIPYAVVSNLSGGLTASIAS